MSTNTIFPYNPALRKRAIELRKKSTLSEILLWNQIKARKLGVHFHRQVPIFEFIVGFYCHELQLAIEIGDSSYDSISQKSENQYKNYCLMHSGIQVICIDNSNITKQLDSVIQLLNQNIIKRKKYLSLNRIQ